MPPRASQQLAPAVIVPRKKKARPILAVALGVVVAAMFVPIGALACLALLGSLLSGSGDCEGHHHQPSPIVEHHLDRSVLEALFEPITPAHPEVRAVPNDPTDRLTGLTLHGIRPGSPLAKLGLEDGDILHRLDHIELGPVAASETIQRADYVLLELTHTGELQLLRVFLH